MGFERILGLSSNMRRYFVFFLVCTLVLSQVGEMEDALAHSYKMDEISVGHVWAPSPNTDEQSLTVFGAILNHGTLALRLVGASTPIAKTVEFRTKVGAEGRKMDSITVPAGKVYAMAPWRGHIVLNDFQRKLKAEDTFEMVLEFDDGRTLSVQVVVESEEGHR